MHQANLRAVGGSVMLTIPRAFMDSLGLKAGAKVGMRLDEGRIVIEKAKPKKKPRYTLDQLLAQCDPNAPFSEEDRQWF